MSVPAQKRLARVLARLDKYDLALQPRQDGSFAAQKNGRTVARLGAKESRAALSTGLLCAHADGTLSVGENARNWLKRKTAPADGNVFAAQHRDMQTIHIIDDAARLSTAHYNAAHSPLSWLYQRKNKDGSRFLSADEFAAGQRFSEDYARSSLAQRVCADWSATPRDKTPKGSRNAVLDAADSALAAKDRVMAALAALGPGLDDLVFALCVRGLSLDALERARHWPRRSAKVIFKIALARLSAHYGLKN